MNDEWLTMRSNIYLRDRGICWVCNTFVDLDQYDLGHLVDRCMDGQDTYDNLAVMHKSCNLSKPRHTTLEEATKWRMTATIGNIRPIIGDSSKVIPRRYPPRSPRQPRQGIEAMPKFPMLQAQPVYIIDKPNNIRRKRIVPDYELDIQQSTDQNLIDRIKPNTLCWIQGKPQYKGQVRSPMWRLLPPPYRREDAFTMRQTPPGAIVPDSNKVIDSIQIINGILEQDVDIYVGFVTYHVTPNGTNKPHVDIIQNSNSNNGIQTIGMGYGQVSLETWKAAKYNGVSWSEFKSKYLSRKPDSIPVEHVRDSDGVQAHSAIPHATLKNKKNEAF